MSIFCLYFSDIRAHLYAYAYRSLYFIIYMSELKIFASTSEYYPGLLKQIPDLPDILYVNGSLPEPAEKLFAVVGTRKPTAYGREAAMYLTRELARAGFSIVSGLALGIDAIAHETALKEGAKTYAVLGCGADVIYPQENKRLYAEIADSGGGIISEYEPGTPPMPFRFPERNRIIAGMSLGTLVVEAKEKSGAMITGRLALEYNREVFAVPGQIFSQYSKGPHALIKFGAKLTESIQDILDEFGMEAVGAKQIMLQNFSVLEKMILELLAEESMHVDAIMVRTGIRASEIHSALTMLEINEAVEHLGGNTYGLKR
jgi:DNA processing protein